MRTAKSIVARYDLCRCIPEGAFANSAFVWITGGYRSGLPWEEPMPREEFFGVPAPTLAEIMDDLKNDPTVSILRVCCGSMCEDFAASAQNERGNCSFTTYIEANPADAALELWFEIRKIKR